VPLHGPHDGPHNIGLSQATQIPPLHTLPAPQDPLGRGVGLQPPDTQTPFWQLCPEPHVVPFVRFVHASVDVIAWQLWHALPGLS
jgi:hypothetical protein